MNQRTTFLKKGDKTYERRRRRRRRNIFTDEMSNQLSRMENNEDYATNYINVDWVSGEEIKEAENK